MNGNKRGQNASANAGAAGTAAAAGGAGRAKRARSTAPRKTKPVLTPGLLADLPQNPAPWLQRCIERWHLVGPYDPSVTEDQWQAYFQERAALEWHTNIFLAQAKEPGSDSDSQEEACEPSCTEAEAAAQQDEQQEEAAWPFDWPKPDGLRKFCREFYKGDKAAEAAELARFLDRMRSGLTRLITGCKGVPGSAELAQALGAGLFITHYWVNWEDGAFVRSMDIRTRLYSPCALATSFECCYTYYNRMRMTFAEHSLSGSVGLRAAAGTNPGQPQQPWGGPDKVLLSMDLQDSGYQKRRLMGAQALKGLAAHLLGRKGLISDRKAFSLALIAAGTTAVPYADVDWVFRVIRRKHKLAAGEESEADAAEDVDSDNEGHKQRNLPRYGGGGRGGGWGGFDDLFGSGSDCGYESGTEGIHLL